MIKETKKENQFSKKKKVTGQTSLLRLTLRVKISGKNCISKTASFLMDLSMTYFAEGNTYIIHVQHLILLSQYSNSSLSASEAFGKKVALSEIALNEIAYT